MPTILKCNDPDSRQDNIEGKEEKRVIRPIKKTSKDGDEKKAKARQKQARTRAEVRKDLVNKYRKVLKNGTYRIKADEIADKMVQKIREDKNQVLF